MNQPFEDKKNTNWTKTQLLQDFYFWFISMKTGLCILGIIAILFTFKSFIPSNHLSLYETINNIEVYCNFLLRLLLILLCLNTFLCTLHCLVGRVNKVYFLRTVSRQKILEALPVNNNFIVLSNDINEVKSQIYEILKRQNFNVRINANNYLYADKGCFSPWGTLITHIGLVVIMAGLLISDLSSLSENIYLKAGETFTLNSAYYSNDSLKMRINEINDNPYNMTTKLTVMRENNETTKLEVRPNYPIILDELKIYQSAFGCYIKTTLFDSNQRIINYDEKKEGDLISIPLTDISIRCFRTTDDSENQQATTSKIAFIIYNKNEKVRMGYVLPGEMVQVSKSINAVFEISTPYTVLMLKKDSGVSTIFIGFALLGLGIFCSLYVKYAKLWITMDIVGPSIHVNQGGDCLKQLHSNLMLNYNTEIHGVD